MSIIDARRTQDNFRYFRNIKNVRKWQSRFSLGPRTCQKYTFCQKILHIKVLKDSVWYKKVSGLIRLSPMRVELGAPKIAIIIEIL